VLLHIFGIVTWGTICHNNRGGECQGDQNRRNFEPMDLYDVAPQHLVCEISGVGSKLEVLPPEGNGRLDQEGAFIRHLAFLYLGC